LNKVDEYWSREPLSQVFTDQSDSDIYRYYYVGAIHTPTQWNQVLRKLSLQNRVCLWNLHKNHFLLIDTFSSLRLWYEQSTTVRFIFYIRWYPSEMRLGGKLKTMTSTPLTGTSMRHSSVFWNITLCSLLEVNWRFGETCRLHLQGRRNSQARNKREAGNKQSNRIAEISDYIGNRREMQEKSVPVGNWPLAVVSKEPRSMGKKSCAEVATSLPLLPHFFLDQHKPAHSRATLVILVLSPIGSLGCVG
jgi:hypothetical protein